MSRTRRNSDEYVRSLERRVTSGDLTVVGELARAYERVGRGQRPIDPEIRRALGLASTELEGEIRSAQDDDRTFGLGGPGAKAFALIQIALEHLDGREPDEPITQAIEHATRDADECEECNARFMNDDDRDPVLCDECFERAGQSDEDAAEERRQDARDRSRGRPGSDPTWSHVSGAPGCPATCPRCGNAGNLHHEAGEHYCAECDDYTAGHSLQGCPGIEDDESDDEDGEDGEDD